MKQRSDTVSKRKRLPRDPESQERHREAFLNALAHGLSPTGAAEAAKIGRSTVYELRQNDPEFARAWDDAVEQGLDRLEDIARARAAETSDTLMALILRGRRPHVYARQPETPAPRVNITGFIPLDDALKRVTDMGFRPPRLIEQGGDYEVLEEAMPSEGTKGRERATSSESAIQGERASAAESTIRLERRCVFCGHTYAEHEDARAQGEPVPRVPCKLLKSGFVAKDG